MSRRQVEGLSPAPSPRPPAPAQLTGQKHWNAHGPHDPEAIPGPARPQPSPPEPAATEVPQVSSAAGQGLSAASTRPGHARRLLASLPAPGPQGSNGTHAPGSLSRDRRRPAAAPGCAEGRGGRAASRPHLHGVQRQVAGNLKLLPEDLLLDVIDAHELGHPSCQDALAVRRVAQRREGPEAGRQERSRPGHPWHVLRSPHPRGHPAPPASWAGLWPGPHETPSPAPLCGSSTPQRDLPRQDPFTGRTTWLMPQGFLVEIRWQRRLPRPPRTQRP